LAKKEQKAFLCSTLMKSYAFVVLLLPSCTDGTLLCVCVSFCLIVVVAAVAADCGNLCAHFIKK
jgi:hypothetical protein